jgi:hypothetical protein
MRAAAFSSGCRSRTALNVVCKESRIGSKPIPVPKGVTVDLKGSHLKVKVRGRAATHIVCVWMRILMYHPPQGPKGELELTLTPYVTIEQVWLSPSPHRLPQRALNAVNSTYCCS